MFLCCTFIKDNSCLHYIILVASLECYNNARNNPNWNTTNQMTTRPITPTNCTAISEPLRIKLRERGIGDANMFHLNLIGCFEGFDFCRVRYTDDGPELGCSCDMELEGREFKMGNNSCKDLNIRESNEYHWKARATNAVLNRILSLFIPRDEHPLIEGRAVRIHRICTCTGNLCNGVSKLRNASIPESTTLNMNSFNTMSRDDSTNMTEKTHREFITKEKIGHTASTEVLNTFDQAKTSSSIEGKNTALGSNNACLHILSIFCTVLAIIR